MFTEDDTEIQQKFDVVNKEWQIKRKVNEKYKKMKENFGDFEYYQDNAQW